MDKQEHCVTIQILDKLYKLRCQPEQEETLHKAALLVDAKMREIKTNQDITQPDRIAILSALQISFDFVQQKEHATNQAENVNERIHLLTEKIIETLSQTEQLEL